LQVARDALGETKIAAEAGDPREDARLIAALLDPRTAVLVSEDLALSRRLEAEPRDPSAHERAALLLGAFALRDHARESTDVRPALARLTAHLALAQALRAGAGPSAVGRLAEAVLATLLGRERDAIARLDALAAPGPAEQAWVRALRLRNTGDWRIARDEKRLTLLETLEEFRALVFGHNDDAALAWLDRRQPAMLPDWGRIALSYFSPSVGTSNRFADLTLALDLADAGEVLTRLRGAPPDEAGYLEALNQRPESCVRPDVEGKPRLAVLGWELWADRFQRSLVFDLFRGNSHRWMLGQPGERKAFVEQARARFGRLQLYPIVMVAHADEVEGYRTAMAAFRELVLHSPERITAGQWDYVREPADFAPVPRDLPDQNTWFRPALPPGTLVDLGGRLQVTQELVTIADPQLRALREQAPHNVLLANVAAGRLPVDNRSAADLAAVYGPLAEYHVRTMAALAQAAWYDPPDYRKRQGALCEIDGAHCLTLGYRLAELGFADEAAVAYQKGFDAARDRVEAANQSRWLVDYYFDHGQLARAQAVAREAAAIYSSNGLFTMARLMERMGRLREAEEYYRRILDRYRDPSQLAGFYYRQARVEKTAAYETKLRETLALALPSGLELLDRSKLPTSPTDGVVIKKENDNTKRYGLHFGHVIVGLDGFRVRDVNAYTVVRALSQSPRMKLVVWRGTSYDEVDAELWDRSFRVEIETLAPPK
jgi:tetratricopeptide (TPR) repeat protein